MTMPPEDLFSKTKKTSEFLSYLKTIGGIAVAGLLVVWAAFEQFDKKFDAIDDLKASVEELNSNVLVISNSIQKTEIKVDRLTENIIGVDHRVISAEAKLTALDEKIKRASEVNKEVPFRFTGDANTNVTDGKPGDYVKVTLSYDKFRQDCSPRTSRVVRDSTGVLHDVTQKATVPDDQISPVGTKQETSFLIKLPEAPLIKIGDAKYQSRVQYTCPDGGAFFITSPWIAFRILDPKAPRSTN